jgi:hypothetical protein
VRVASDFDLGRLLDALEPRPAREWRVPVRRPDDLLVFDLLFDNLELKQRDGRPCLERRVDGARALLVVALPPQSFGEEAFRLADDFKEPVPPLPSARIRMSGPSRLAFVMPPDSEFLPYTLHAVLEAMRTWPLQLAATALPDPELPSRSWLIDALTSDVFDTTFTRLAVGLEAAGADGATAAIEEAAQRVAERAAGGLATSAQDALGRVTLEAMQGEIEELKRGFQALSKGAAHQAGIAALSLASARSLAPAARRTDAAAGLLAELPYLRLLLSPHKPSALTTALELPYRLLLSPIEQAGWMHRDDLVAHRGRTELWHTRLRTAQGKTGADGTAKVRALWSPDYPINAGAVSDEADPKPFRMSLNALDRQMLVRLMSGYGELKPDGRRYTPRPSRARRLHLSALGALLDAEGQWDPRPDDVDLEQWRHLAGVGRDAYVRVVYVGFLVGFGHDAALLKVTERKFESLGATSGNRIAVLRQREFVVVRRRVMEYDGSGHVHGGRNFPFTRIEILTRVTPDLWPAPGDGDSELKAAPGDTIYSSGPPPPQDTEEAKNVIARRMAFWPMMPTAGGGSTDVRFEILATDISGRQQCFSMPLLFVSEIVNRKKAPELRRAYDLPETALRRTASFGGSTVCYAPFAPGVDKSDPNLPTQSIRFRAGDRSFSVYRPNFYPEIEAASVGIPPLQKLLGKTDALANVTYPQIFKDHGFGESDPSENKGKVFLQLLGEKHELAFGGSGVKSDALGALAAPQMTILGLSKVMGPVAGKAPTDLSVPKNIEDALGKVVGGTFDPIEFFNGATILGGVELSKILVGAASLAGADVPKLVSREATTGPKRVETRFDWATTIDHSDPLNLIIPSADKVNASPLTMKGLVTTPLEDAANADYEATATLKNFKVNLFGFIILWFDDLNFAARKGQKPDVAVGLHPTDSVMFGGPLEFVNELKNYIPSNGFTDPPAIAVTPSGIAAGYSLTLPSIGVGVFALKNLSLGAGFNLPFDATPASVKFNFSERQRPFSLTVSLLGGGGFFAIGISARGVQEIEAAIEFGAEVSINLGVASGGVEIKAGVYFHWLEKVPNKGSVELSGYVRLHGELSVLGLISASLVFNLQLSFIKEGGATEVFGEATLTVEVEVVFVSFDVSVTCRKEFAGGEGDPKFIELVPDEATWDEYCGAFAQEAA